MLFWNKFIFLHQTSILHVSQHVTDFDQMGHLYNLGPKKLIIHFPCTFLRKWSGRAAFYFLFFLMNSYKMIYDLWHSSQSTNKMAANEGCPKLTIYKQFFSVNTRNVIKIFDVGVKGYTCGA